ncbi:hypothetical protein [Embleya sp. NPDC005971]|uniref:hypothetical protein n=1 Tax=Embleya sp. NPDC005971 TaxID=3156724 RepID=UPI0033CF7D4C
MTGGAVAGGYRATAEDRSERVGSWEASAGTDVPCPSVPPSSSGVSVGTMAGGAVAAGWEARAVDASRRLISASPELVGSLEVLRSQLPLLARTQDDGIDEVAGQLAAIEGEIANGGQTERHRLERLRMLLTGGGTVAGGLASALAVVESITQMLG